MPNEELGFQRIGSLLPQISSSPSSEGTAEPTSLTSPSNFETTGSRSPARTPTSSTGRELGKTGFSASPNSVAENDQALIRSLPQSVTSCLVMEEDSHFTEDGAFICKTKHFSLAADPEHLDEARDLVRAAYEPLPRDEIVKLLARLKVVTIRRGEGEADLTLQFSAYADDLSKWPADVVREVLMAWDGKWWPALAELEDAMTPLATPRRKLLYALEHKPRPYRTEIVPGVWVDGAAGRRR